MPAFDQLSDAQRNAILDYVLVVAQPQGALYAYATQIGSAASIAQGRSLVVDVGSRTFDWLVTRGMKVVTKMSNSVTRGVSDVLIGIATLVLPLEREIAMGRQPEVQTAAANFIRRSRERAND